MKLINTELCEDTILQAIIRSQEKYHESKKEYLDSVEADVEFSVTTLAKSPRMVQIEKRHWDEIEIDVRDRYASVLGSLMHKIAEENPMAGDLVEKRYGRTFLLTMPDGAKVRVHIHGMCDRYNLGKGYMKDYKFSAMAAMNYDKEDYCQQLNILRMILPEEERNQILTLSNIFIFRDYRASEAKAGRSAQPMFCKELEHPIWQYDYAKTVLRERVLAHLCAVPVADDDLPFCTEKELWMSRSGYRIRHKTQKKEWSKVSSGWAETKEEAETMAALKKPGVEFQLERTIGSPRRCHFCNAYNFCNQRKTMIADAVQDTETELEI